MFIPYTQMIETSVTRVSTTETQRCKKKYIAANITKTLKLWNEDEPHIFIISLLAIC